MALGPYPDLSLANARKKTAEARELLALGTYPKTQRDGHCSLSASAINQTRDHNVVPIR